MMPRRNRFATSGLVGIATGIIMLMLAGGAQAAPKKKRVLYLGDSMSMGAFGKTLDKEMRAAGHEVYTFVVGGATPYYWLSRYSTIKGPIGYWEKTPSTENRRNITKGVPKVESLLERFNPDVVVIQTGTNLYATLRSKRRSKENNVKEVEGVINHMIEAATQGGRKCYWITPPEAHPGRYPTELQAELADLTKRIVGRNAKVFDSRTVTKYTDPYPKNDGIHYGATEAKQWARHVVRDFDRFMGSDSRSAPPQGMLAGEKKLRRGDLTPERIAAAPRAIPVSAPKNKIMSSPARAPKLARVEERPPVKSKPKPAPIAKVTPPVKKKPPVPEVVEKKERPPVQYVKKAISIETKGIKWGKLDLEVELIKKSKLKSLKDIDYSYCFAMNEYKVLKVNSGYYPHPTIRIARVVMWGKKLVPRAVNESVGYRPRGGWELIPMSDYPRFEQMQLVDELPINLDLPIYIVAFD